jgi:hypothetical protein
MEVSGIEKKKSIHQFWILEKGPGLKVQFVD